MRVSGWEVLVGDKLARLDVSNVKSDVSAFLTISVLKVRVVFVFLSVTLAYLRTTLASPLNVIAFSTALSVSEAISCLSSPSSLKK